MTPEQLVEEIYDQYRVFNVLYNRDNGQSPFLKIEIIYPFYYCWAASHKHTLVFWIGAYLNDHGLSYMNFNKDAIIKTIFTQKIPILELEKQIKIIQEQIKLIYI